MCTFEKNDDVECRAELVAVAVTGVLLVILGLLLLLLLTAEVEGTARDEDGRAKGVVDTAEDDAAGVKTEIPGIFPIGVNGACRGGRPYNRAAGAGV